MATKRVQYNATITYKKMMTESLALFRVVPDEPTHTPFIPGQYSILGLNHPVKGGVQRAYSIASPPYLAKDYYEYYIRYVYKPTSDNPLTHLLWKVEEGDRILQRSKITGHFTVEKTVGIDDKRLRVLVAAGTGLAPFTSMVFEHYHNHGNIGPYAIVHGASYPTDLGYREELEELMNSEGKTRYVSTISRPNEVPEWKGMTGRAESHFEPGKIEKLEEELGLGEGGLNPENCIVMICGLQGTIAQTLMGLFYRGFVPGDRKLRREFGVPKELPPSVFFEQYDTEPVINTRDEELMAELIQRLRNAGVPLEKDQPAHS